MTESDPTRSGPTRFPGEAVRGGPASLELRPGEPFLGEQGPPGARFLGWVLVQVWETPAGRDGCKVQLGSTPSDRRDLVRRAAAKLEQGWPKE